MIERVRQEAVRWSQILNKDLTFGVGPNEKDRTNRTTNAAGIFGVKVWVNDEPIFCRLNYRIFAIATAKIEAEFAQQKIRTRSRQHHCFFNRATSEATRGFSV
jgi:hypothetical protein